MNKKEDLEKYIGEHVEFTKGVFSFGEKMRAVFIGIEGRELKFDISEYEEYNKTVDQRLGFCDWWRDGQNYNTGYLMECERSSYPKNKIGYVPIESWRDLRILTEEEVIDFRNKTYIFAGSYIPWEERSEFYGDFDKADEKARYQFLDRLREEWWQFRHNKGNITNHFKVGRKELQHLENTSIEELLRFIPTSFEGLVFHPSEEENSWGWEIKPLINPQ